MRDILLLAIGAKEDVKQIYRQVCYAEMSEVCFFLSSEIEENPDFRCFFDSLASF